MHNRLRVIRAERQITQATLAKMAGLSRVTVNRIEGGRHMPDGNTMMKLARALGCPAKDIFTALA